ncbi:MAG: hypothetical protein COZ57_18050 [Armatimonadetes bacterium CG_4_8_14_3_um_filter_66_20]|nr:MAG: hypothetical protein COZ57_18050 [Armatimonadetes bacterium CG_4_8_14_3_um_filter_66_20]
MCGVGACCLLLLSLSTLSAQVPDPAMPMDPAIGLTPIEETALDPMVMEPMPVDPVPMDPALVDATNPVPVADPVPDPAATEPAPPDDWDLNDQGVYDPSDFFAVYMGTWGGFDAWTNHLLYRQKCERWYSVLAAKAEVATLLSQDQLGGLEIRYWYDPIPGPLSYAAHWVVKRPNGRFLADLYAMTPDQRDYRLDELDLLFGRSLLLTPDVFRTVSSLDGEGSMVDGYVFAYGDVVINKRTEVTGTVYANGKVWGKGDYVVGGAVPSNLSAPLDLVASYYDVLPLFAEAATKPAKDVTRTDKLKLSDLPGQICYVNGTLSLEKGGEIAGPGIVVAIGSITVAKDSVLGDGVTLISRENVRLQKDATIGSEAILWAMGTIRIEDESSLASGSLLSVGDIEIGRGCRVRRSLLVAGKKVRVQAEAEVQGAIISLDDVELGK